MVFVKFVILYDVIIGFLVLKCRLYLKGMDLMDKDTYSSRIILKNIQTLGYFVVLALFLTFVAALIFLIHIMF